MTELKRCRARSSGRFRSRGCIDQSSERIIARDPVFVASQPWPFPASLMLGFHAVSDGGEPRATDGELEEVRWLGRDAIQEAIDGGDPGFQLPPAVSIARFLVDRWAERS